MRSTIITIISILAFASCQKVIKIDLNSTDPKYVIEGNITDRPGAQLIKISRSVNFDESNTFPAVSGAVVLVTDITTSVTDTLHEATPGNYTTSHTGIPGHSYKLIVKVGGKEFSASSAMPTAIVLDSLYSSKSAISRRITLVPVYTDPVAKGNYYHFAEYRNNVETDNIYIRNDDFINGQVMTSYLTRGGGDIELEIGDSVAIDLQCIDAAMYEYYFSLQQTKNQNAATPANPITNLTGGALGYFSAHTSSSRKIEVR